MCFACAAQAKKFPASTALLCGYYEVTAAQRRTVLQAGELGHEEAVEGGGLVGGPRMGGPLCLRLVAALDIRHLTGGGCQQVAHGQHVRRPGEGQQLTLGLLQRRRHLHQPHLVTPKVQLQYKAILLSL